MPGYSNTPLIKKLGYAHGDVVCSVGEPEWYSRFLLEHGIEEERSLPAIWAHVFVTSRDELEDIISNLTLEDIKKGLWVSWPKKSSGVAGDITENDLREIILPLGWVDTKVCAIDEIWSGLKFVRRTK